VVSAGLRASASSPPSLLEVADPDHITYGSDFPYENFHLSPDLRAAIDRGNCEALFPRLKV
jgi:6-methylsalicylate decarboxylase